MNECAASCGKAGVHRERDAGDAGRAVGGEEGDGFGDFFRLNDAAERIVPRQLWPECPCRAAMRWSHAGVRIEPGQTAFALTPRPPYSTAMARVKALMPALAAA